MHGDGLGSVRALTDETGTTIDTRGYEAFGTKNVEAGSDPLTYGFAGEPFQQDSMLAYHRARWMDARVGRFLGMDAKDGDNLRPGTLHRYLYAGDEPVAHVDPSGNDSLAELGLVATVVSVLALTADSSLSAGSAFTSSFPVTVNLFDRTPQPDVTLTLDEAFRTVGIDAVYSGGVSDAMQAVLQSIGNRKLGRLNVVSHNASPGVVTFGNDTIAVNEVDQNAAALGVLGPHQWASTGFAVIEECFSAGGGGGLLQRLSGVWGVPVYGWTQTETSLGNNPEGVPTQLGPSIPVMCTPYGCAPAAPPVE